MTFNPPSLDDITAYAKKLGYESFDSIHFRAWHEAHHWKRRAWKRAVVAWQVNALRFAEEERNHPTVFGHAPGWDRRPDEALAQEGVNLEALRKAREAEK